MTRDEAIQVAGMLQDASVNAIELSGGTIASPEKLRRCDRASSDRNMRVTKFLRAFTPS